MITTTSIIISVLLSLLLRKLEDNPQLVIPTMILLTVCVVTMVFSHFSQQDLHCLMALSHPRILRKRRSTCRSSQFLPHEL